MAAPPLERLRGGGGGVEAGNGVARLRGSSVVEGGSGVVARLRGGGVVKGREGGAEEGEGGGVVEGEEEGAEDGEVAASSSRAEKEEQKEERRTVRVTSNDGEEFEMDEAVARGSVMLRHMMELGIALDGITLPIVSGEILALAVSYLRVHRDYDDGGYGYGYRSESEDTALTNFDRDLVKQLDQATLIDLLSASNYLEIEGLLRLTCQTVAEKLKGKTTEEIRQTFCIQNDYPPEEEEEVREEISWALEEKSLD
uniref:Uncharacterized protein n=1 Tax=Ananas comosus var. bracteatus TaxID=296719 RepID=A0A6V7PHY5_ANACO|nr:unnamed protein product [Ananas comosus var. bracteatus]